MAERMWIKNRLAELGLRQADMARAVGISEVQVHQIIRGTRQIKPREWAKTAALLQIPVAELSRQLGVDLDPTLSTSSGKHSTSTKPEVVFAGELPRNTVKDLPVYGSAEGGDGVMVMDNEPIEYIERPPGLEGVRGAYAIYVVNDSMSPAYEPGDKALIHPGKPVAPGKDALFISEDPDGTRHAMVKRLVRVTAIAWKVQQFNPARTFDLPKGKWQKAHRIVGSLRAD